MSEENWAPVEWRPWPADPRYKAASNGAILGARGHVLNPWRNESGYQQVTVYKGGRRGKRRNAYVHVIVCEAWHGPRPDGMHPTFLNGDRTDCRPENLAWRTPSALVGAA